VAIGTVRVEPVLFKGAVQTLKAFLEGPTGLGERWLGCLGRGGGRLRGGGGGGVGGRLPIEGGVAGTRLAEVLPPAVPLLRLLSRLMGTKGRERCLAPC
jgi:hypothetical protein